MGIHYLSCGIYLVAGIVLTAGVRLFWSSTQRLAGRLSKTGVMTTKRYLSGLTGRSKITQYMRENKVNSEIYESIVLLRNIISLNKGDEMAAENVISILSSQMRLLQPAYGKMLTLLRVGKVTEAYETFERETRTDMGKELGSILLHWDEVEPSKLLEILKTQQQNLRQRKITAQRRRDEIISEAIYFPVIINVFVIFINFIFVGFFFQQQELLESIF